MDMMLTDKDLLAHQMSRNRGRSKSLHPIIIDETVLFEGLHGTPDLWVCSSDIPEIITKNI